MRFFNFLLDVLGLSSVFIFQSSLYIPRLSSPIYLLSDFLFLLNPPFPACRLYYTGFLKMFRQDSNTCGAQYTKICSKTFQIQIADTFKMIQNALEMICTRWECWQHKEMSKQNKTANSRHNWRFLKPILPDFWVNDFWWVWCSIQSCKARFEKWQRFGQHLLQKGSGQRN